MLICCTNLLLIIFCGFLWRVRIRNDRAAISPAVETAMGSPAILSRVASCIVVLLTHFALFVVPRLLPSISLLAMLPIAAMVVVASHAVARYGRRLLRIKASAPATVFGHILFLWGVHMAVIRYEEISSLLDASLNIECVLLLIGLYKILYCDPGVVTVDSTCAEVLCEADSFRMGPHYKSSPFFSRIRHCSSCKRNVMGYDHHCPAFGNCIGQKNHYLFMILVFGFIITEATYTTCSTQCMSGDITSLLGTQRMSLERNQYDDLVISTMLFSFLQVVWQVFFLTWHIYCICCNIKTEEWINWTKYPEFQIITQPLPGSPFPGRRFVNPYNKGIVSNIKEYLISSLMLSSRPGILTKAGVI